MSAVHKLITDHLDIWTAADTEKKSGRGRASGNANSVYGIKKLRELILELAVRGKLVPQNENDEPASEFLDRIDEIKKILLANKKIKKNKNTANFDSSEAPFRIPENWRWEKLGTLSTKLTDGSHNPPKDAGEGIPMLSSQNVNFGKIDFSTPSRFVIHEDFELEDARTQIEPDDVLLTIVASLGRPAVVPKDAPKFVLQRSVAVIKTGLFPHYLCLHLASPYCLAYYDEHGKGTAQKGIYLGQLSELPIAVPPIAEQHRIVAKVDELMALCDQLEAQHNNAADAHEQLVSHLLSTLTQSQDAADFNANWQRIATHFDTLFTTESSIDSLKQTLLQLAVMGKLVPQDPSDEPASELLKRIEDEKATLVAEGKIKKTKPLAAIGDSPFDLPPNWIWARFPEVGEFGRGKSKHRPRNDPKLFNPEIYPLVQTGEVARADNLISEYHSKYSEFGLAQSKMWPQGTMCITIAANIADTAILGFDACFPDSVVGFVPYTPLKDARYFLYFMKTARADLLKFAPATAQKNINLEILESVLIPIPPLNEISRIAAKVDKLMTLCEHLKSRITDSRQNQRKLADVLMDQALML
jgi:type I restriction enzyme S subunit